VFRYGFAVALVLAFAHDAGAACDPDTVTVHSESGERVFTIEIADDPDEQAQGLMFRPQLADNAGMLFIFDRPRPASFWMQNTMIPLDMIFIEENGLVESIAERKDTYSQRESRSAGPVRAVLEINAGLSRQLGIGPGTRVVHSAFKAAPDEFRCPD
jgi:uncharacterized membrane protein (UPF0127 family)